VVVEKFINLFDLNGIGQDSGQRQPKINHGDPAARVCWKRRASFGDERENKISL